MFGVGLPKSLASDLRTVRGGTEDPMCERTVLPPPGIASFEHIKWKPGRMRAHMYDRIRHGQSLGTHPLLLGMGSLQADSPCPGWYALLHPAAADVSQVIILGRMRCSVGVAPYAFTWVVPNRSFFCA